MSATVTRCTMRGLLSDPAWPAIQHAYGSEGRYHGMPEPSPQLDAYCALEDAGAIVALRADDADGLCGFAIMLVQRSLHYGVVVAMVESIYAMPRARAAVGRRLLAECEAVARDAGARAIVATAPVGSRLGTVYGLRGYRASSTTYYRMDP